MASNLQTYKEELTRMKTFVSSLLEGEDADAADVADSPAPIAPAATNPAMPSLAYPNGVTAAAPSLTPEGQFAQPMGIPGMGAPGLPGIGASAITSTMNTGDPSLAAQPPLAPGAAPFAPAASGAVPGADVVPAAATGLSDEEMQVVEAFRKFKKDKVMAEKKVGLKPKGKKPVKESDEMGGFSSFGSGPSPASNGFGGEEAGEEGEEASIDKLTDYIIDLGKKLEVLKGGDDEGSETAEEEHEEHEESETPEEEAVEEKAKKDAFGEAKKRAQKIAAIKKFIAEKKNKKPAKKVVEAELDEPVVDDPFDLIDSISKLAMKNNDKNTEDGIPSPADMKISGGKIKEATRTEKFAQRYIEKKKLNFDKLIADGMIG